MPKKKAAGTPAPQSITEAFTRIQAWLKRQEPKWKPLKKAATPAQLAKAEAALGHALPDELREWFQCHNGTNSDGFFCTDEGGSFYLLSISDLVSSWKSSCQVLDCGDYDGKVAKPDKGVQAWWWDRHWLPFASNGGGDEWCVDLAPAKGGQAGQVIVAISNAPRRQRIAASLLAWLGKFTTELEAGKLVYDRDEGGLIRLGE